MYKDWLVAYRGYNNNSSSSINNVQFFYKRKLIGSKNVVYSSDLYCNFIYASDTEIVWACNKGSFNSENCIGYLVNADTNQITDIDNINLLDRVSSFYFDGSTIFTRHYERWDKQTNTVKQYESIPNGTMLNWLGVPNFIYGNYSKDDTETTLIKFNYDSELDTYTQISKKYGNIVGVNYFGNKIFRYGNIYKLNEDLSIGELLKENAYPHQTGGYGVCMTCINDRYYLYSPSYNTTYFYEFDEDTNSFKELTISDTDSYKFITSINSLALIKDVGSSSATTISTNIKQFNFNKTSTEIGINYKDTTMFYQPKIVFNSNDLLERNIFHNK